MYICFSVSEFSAVDFFFLTDTERKSVSCELLRFVFNSRKTFDTRKKKDYVKS